MGLNILVKRIKDKTLEDNWSFGKTLVYNTEDVDWWDDDRFAYDREFIGQNEFYFVDANDQPMIEQELMRPKDIQKCKEWVLANVGEYNQLRLIDVLDRFEADENLVFVLSY